MNLHGIVSPYIGLVNPQILATLKKSSGYTSGADGSRVPTYVAYKDVLVQVQALGYNDIQQVSGLNIQGVRRKIYLNGDWEGVIRADQKGGDIIVMPDGTTYLVVLVLEHWPDWTSAAVTLQNNS